MKVELNDYCFDTKEINLIYPINEGAGICLFKINFKNGESINVYNKENKDSLKDAKKLRDYLIKLWMNNQEFIHIIKIEEDLKKIS